MKIYGFLWIVVIFLIRAIVVDAADNTFAMYTQLIWSSDGSRIAYTMDSYQGEDQSNRQDLLSYDLYRRSRVCLTPRANRLRISPDGQEIIFKDMFGVYRTEIGRWKKTDLLLFKDPTASDRLIDMQYGKDGSSFYYIARRRAPERYEMWRFKFHQKSKELVYSARNLKDNQLSEFWSNAVYSDPNSSRKNDFISPDIRKRLVVKSAFGELSDIFVDHQNSALEGRYFQQVKLVWFRWFSDPNMILIALLEDKNGDGVAESPSTWILYLNRLEKFCLAHEIIQDPHITEDSWLIYIRDEQIHIVDLQSGEQVIQKTNMIPKWYNTNQPVTVYPFNPTNRDKRAKTGFYLHRGNIWEFNRKDSFLIQLTQMGNVTEAAVSPTKDKVAFIRQGVGKSFPYSEIWIMNPNGTGQKKVVDKMKNF